MTQKLLKILPKPIYCALPEGAKNKIHNPPEIIAVAGKRHGNLQHAQEWISQYGRTLASFKRIIANIRNPYAMEVSRYFYLRLNRPWDQGQAQTIALTSDFETFAVESNYFGRKLSHIEDYFLIEGEIPNNMMIIQQEQLDADLNRALTNLNLALDTAIPRQNATKHQDYHQYLTPQAEAAIYHRYQWLFDAGFYPRENFALNKTI